MRARSREINILICRCSTSCAERLGAFCFMMLVLLPYYKPPGKETDLHKQEVKTQDLLDELEKLRANAQEVALAQQMTAVDAETPGTSEADAGSAQSALGRKSTARESEPESGCKKRQTGSPADMRHPFLVTSVTYPSQELDIYLDARHHRRKQPTKSAIRSDRSSGSRFSSLAMSPHGGRTVASQPG